MAGQRQPIELVVAKGKKNLTKAEIEERRKREIAPITDNIAPPSYLSKKQKDEFVKIAEQLKKLKIMGETDVDALARYIMSKDLYIKLSKQITRTAVLTDPILLDKYMKNQDRMFKQCRASATDLGLTISSRCKLVVPEPQEPPKKNKFAKFEKRQTVNE